jgi:hypothetical protein
LTEQLCSAAEKTTDHLYLFCPKQKRNLLFARNIKIPPMYHRGDFVLKVPAENEIPLSLEFYLKRTQMTTEIDIFNLLVTRNCPQGEVTCNC